MQGTGCRGQDAGDRMQDAGGRMQDPPLRIQDAGSKVDHPHPESCTLAEDELQKTRDLGDGALTRGGHSQHDVNRVAKIRDVRTRCTNSAGNQIGQSKYCGRLRATSLSKGLYSVSRPRAQAAFSRCEISHSLRPAGPNPPQPNADKSYSDKVKHIGQTNFTHSVFKFRHNPVPSLKT